MDKDKVQSFIDMAAADHVRGGWLDGAARDVRYGLRQLQRTPAFSIVAIATLALGIGGITAMFSVFDVVLIRSMPYAEAGRLVMVWDDMTGHDVTTKLTPAPAEWLEWRRLNTVFTDLAISESVEATVSGDGDPEQVPARSVSWTFWTVLGVKPGAGAHARSSPAPCVCIERYR